MSIACKKLNFGDNISVISPSSKTSKDIIDISLKKLEELGFNYKIYKNLYKDSGYLAGSDEERSCDFNLSLMDKETNAIMCMRGGYGTLRILDSINWELFSKNPKIFMGFSDITPILNYIFKKFNTITFHSPMLTSNLNEPHSKESLLNSIMISKENYYIENPKHIKLKSFPNTKKISQGHIVGGNLSLICSLIGSKYEIPFENNILFIEEINEPPYKIDRMLMHLYLSGRINKCSGIILGQFTNCEDDNNVNINDVLIEKLNLFNKPSIYNLCAGHGEPRITIPIGAKVEINTKLSTIKILEKIVF